MAASQARFLGLTARKNNVEYEGQQINQQRTALSNKSASYYSDLLGMAVPVCPAVEDFTQTIYSFTDGALNNSVTSLIARGDGSYNLSYLSSYTDDFAMVSAGATSLVNDNLNGYMVGADKLKGLGEDLYYSYVLREGSYTYRLYERSMSRSVLPSTDPSTLGFTYTDKNGETQAIVPATYDIITSIIGPEPRIEDYDVGPLLENYRSKSCFTSVHSSQSNSQDRAYHIEHNICRLMWSDGRTSVTSSDGVTLTRTDLSYYSLAKNTGDQSTDSQYLELQNVLASDFPDVYQELIDMYVGIVQILNNIGDSGHINRSLFTLSDTTYDPSMTIDGIYADWQDFWDNVGDLDRSYVYYRDHDAWQAKYDPYVGTHLDANDYTKVYRITERQMYYDGQDEYLKSLSADQLENLYDEEVTYRDMLEAKYGQSEDGWYVRYKQNSSTNEWEPTFYRGDDIAQGFKDNRSNVITNIETYKIGSCEVQNEIKGKTAYLEQDSTGRFINVTIDGKTYALTTNTVMDQNAYDDAMNQYEYDKAIYEQKIDEINAKIEIIQAEDKNLELRLKQLDTEHQAIDNELDAVSKVIDKSVESSFKTFG